MGLYTKVGSTTQEITQLSVNVDGVAKNVHTVYTQIDGVRTRLFPSTEVWTLVYEGTNPGSYTYNADWGSYQIVLSGGGGSGAGIARHGDDDIRVRIYDGGARAEELTTSIKIYQNDSKVFSGTLGSGASGAYVRSDGGANTSSAGAAGSGEGNGSVGQSAAGNNATLRPSYYAISSGSGGGSSSLYVDNVLTTISKGGNGGTCQVRIDPAGTILTKNGGAGGSGGTGGGSGAAGGAGISIWKSAAYTGAGANGYVRIYKSNILPEPTVVLNLNGAQQYVEDTVYPAGKYRVTVQAGSCYPADATYASSKITQIIDVSSPFVIRAYCGSSATSTSGGINPYSGNFKVNGRTDNTAITTVNHIFGNAGSCFVISGAASYSKAILYSSGNCLGNGGYLSSKSSGIGAGSCLHLMPVGGTFGTDYLFAFHCAAGTYGSAGGGSAYGGAGSGQAFSGGTAAGTATVIAGGSTPYGTGGAGHSVTRAQENGYNGSGIGYGYGGGISGNGAGAWFDGTTWNDSRTIGAPGEQGQILIEYYEE